VTQRIDVFTHFVPPTLLDDLEAVSGTPHVFRTLFEHKPTLVDLDRRVELLDRFDIDVNMLVPLPWLDTVPAAATDREVAPRVARRANDSLAEEIARHPTRFAGVGLIPTVTPAAILSELEYVGGRPRVRGRPRSGWADGEARRPSGLRGAVRTVVRAR